MWKKNVKLTALAALSSVLLYSLAAAQTEKPQPLKTTDKKCGAYTVRTVENGFDDPEDSISLIRGGRTYVKLTDVMVEMQQCGDITGDGVPEVVLMQFSGGAHCCATHSVYTLSTPPRRILRAFTGHGDSIGIEQLDGQGAKEILSNDWRFAYAYGMSFADSPALPLIYSYQGGQYVENTRAFPGWLLKNVVPATSKNFAGGDALYSYGLYLLAGQPAGADAYLKTLRPEDRAWLENYAPDIRQSMDSAGIQDWPQRAGVKDENSAFGLGGAFTRPGVLEYLTVIKEAGSAASLRLYHKQGSKIISSPALQTFALPVGEDFSDLRWWPGFTVRRSSGRDDAIVEDRTNGNVRYPVYRVSNAAATQVQNDPLAVAAGLLADVSSVSRLVQRRYERNSDHPLSAAQLTELDRKIGLAAQRAQPWANLNSSKLDLPKLGYFSVQSVEVGREDKTTSLVAGVVEVASVTSTDFSIADSQRYTYAIFLENRNGTWAVTRWQLTPRTGEFTYREGN